LKIDATYIARGYSTSQPFDALTMAPTEAAGLTPTLSETQVGNLVNWFAGTTQLPLITPADP